MVAIKIRAAIAEAAPITETEVRKAGRTRMLDPVKNPVPNREDLNPEWAGNIQVQAALLSAADVIVKLQD